MDFNQKRTLGRTGLKVGRLGISSSFGAPAAAYEEAFERGCNYYNAVHRGAESDTFPSLTGDNRPGVVAFTATSWQQLLKSRKMPPGEPPLTAADCYRFVLSHYPLGSSMSESSNRSLAKTLRSQRNSSAPFFLAFFAAIARGSFKSAGRSRRARAGKNKELSRCPMFC